jgi:peptidyl-prolyl cis-trans isomerase SurA
LKRRIAILATLAVCAFAASCKNQTAPGPDVWAVVNGKEISRSDVEKYYRTRVNSEGPAPSQEESLSLKLSILDELINNEIMLERANKNNLVASDAEVADKFTESKSPYTEEEFQKKLRDTGLTVDDLKSEIRRQLSVQKLLNREVVAKISITDQDVTDFYNKNRAQFNVVEQQYHIGQIVITPRPDPAVHNRKNDKSANEAEAGKKAALLDQKLRGGADFAQLAMDYSEDSTASTGGDIGFVSESALNRSDPLLKKTVLAMKPGEVTRPISDHGGYRILKMIAKEPAGQRELSDPKVQQTIRDTLRNRKEQLLRNAYLMEARTEAKVTNYLAVEIIQSSGKLPAPR